jgi:3-oxoacyl-[acyl-carrier-protein] synthase II
VATALDVRGPVLTVTDFAFAFQQAAVLAECWLIEGRCEYVLLTCVEEVGHVLAHVCARLLHVPADGRLTPFRFDARPAVVPGEGAVCFVLSLHSGPDTEATAMQVVAGPPAVPSPVTILDTGSLLPDESAYLGLVPAGGELANYAPVFGSMMTGTGFQCAVAVRSLRNGLRYASPIADNPHGLVIRDRTEPVVTPAIACVKCGCRGECMTVYLRHPRPAAQAPEGTPHADTVDRRGG